MFKKVYKFNKPLSPHLLVYLPQFSSLFSIWHRICGFALFLLLLFNIFLPEILFNQFNISIFTFFYITYWFSKFFILLFFILFVYHSLNGFRHIFSDFLLFLDSKKLWYSYIFILIFMVLILIYFTLWTVYYAFI